MESAPLLPREEASLRAIFAAGLAAVAPDTALRRLLRVEERPGANLLWVGKDSCPLSASRRIFVLGAGKGVAPMAQAVEDLLDAHIFQGMVIAKYDHGLPLRRIALSEAAHPVPDAAGERAAHALLRLAREAGREDLVICLFTGGASALTPALFPGLRLEDVQATTALLLGCGASIHEVNAVRKHLSVFSGGQLARAAFPAPVLSLLVSDVLGDDLDVIASGPTAPDSSTFAHCLEIFRHYDLVAHLPGAVWQHLCQGAKGLVPETPKAGDPLFAGVHNHVLASLPQALEAAAAQAALLGFAPRIVSSSLSGEARHKAEDLVAEALAEAQSLPPEAAPLCLLAGGETTVRLHSAGSPSGPAASSPAGPCTPMGPWGKGGRNQEMALAASLAMQGQSQVCALFAGTDGSDGPTDAAGGFACGDTVARGAQCGLDARACLDAHDSYPFLEGCGRLLKTGPTRTNVMDMAILLVFPPPETQVADCLGFPRLGKYSV